MELHSLVLKREPNRSCWRLHCMILNPHLFLSRTRRNVTLPVRVCKLLEEMSFDKLPPVLWPARAEVCFTLSVCSVWSTPVLTENRVELHFGVITPIATICSEETEADSWWKQWFYMESSGSYRWMLNKRLIKESDFRGAKCDPQGNTICGGSTICLSKFQLILSFFDFWEIYFFVWQKKASGTSRIGKQNFSWSCDICQASFVAGGFLAWNAEHWSEQPSFSANLATKEKENLTLFCISGCTLPALPDAARFIGCSPAEAILMNNPTPPPAGTVMPVTLQAPPRPLQGDG